MKTLLVETFLRAPSQNSGQTDASLAKYVLRTHPLSYSKALQRWDSLALHEIFLGHLNKIPWTLGSIPTMLTILLKAPLGVDC